VRSKTSITTNQGIELNRETIYYEIELGQSRLATKVQIGLSNIDHFSKNDFPGETKDSIGINLFTGAIYKNGKEIHSYGFNAQFGDTIGIGYTFETGNVWFFYNGKFLNDPSAGSPKKNPYGTKNMTEEEIKKMEAEEKAKEKLHMNPKVRYYPVIGADNDCTLLLNVGGATFRNNIPEMSAGLL